MPTAHVIFVFEIFNLSLSLLNCELKFSLYYAGQRTGILCDSDSVTSRLDIWSSPRKPA